jgi:hypothetical protein
MKHEFTDIELESEMVTELPDRAEMSLINLNAAIPINAAVALNALSDGSTAVAYAQQASQIPQVA